MHDGRAGRRNLVGRPFRAGGWVNGPRAGLPYPPRWLAVYVEHHCLGAPVRQRVFGMRNRSWDSDRDGRWHSGAVRFNGSREIAEQIPLLPLAGLGHVEQPLDRVQPSATLRAERGLPPDHARPQRPLGFAARRLGERKASRLRGAGADPPRDQPPAARMCSTPSHALRCNRSVGSLSIKALPPHQWTGRPVFHPRSEPLLLPA